MKIARIVTLICLIVLLITACVTSPPPELTLAKKDAFEVKEDVEAQASATAEPLAKNSETLDAHFAIAGFELVAGQYSRKIVNDDTTITELFVLEKHNFVQVATNNLEQEVFAYNYLSDDFTYLYYFDGTLSAKTKINLETGAVLLDDGEYADLLWADAELLKQHFYDILTETGLTVDVIS